MKTNQEKVSYLIGRQIAGNLLTQKLDLISEFLFKGIEGGLNDEEMLLEPEEAKSIFEAFQNEMDAKLNEETKVFAEMNQKAGEEFLAENAKKDGVIAIDSGIQYKVLTEGSGEIPKGTDTVETHYEGSLIDGEVFDSSIQRGESISFPVGGVIQGWQEVLQLMPVGSKWEVFIPGHLAYGEAGSPPKIGPNATLVFIVELIAIV